MWERFICKLERFSPLTTDHRTVLRALPLSTLQFGPRAAIQRENAPRDRVRLMLDGVAVRYKALANGPRQIVGILVPGDLCDPFGLILPTADHAIGTLTSCTVASLRPQDILTVTQAHAAIAQALRWSSLAEEATLREWLLNVGQRPPAERIAHLFCELLVRLQVVGLASDNTYVLPMTQYDLAETTGLSMVHVNRTLQGLRGGGLIGLRSGRVTIPDVARLTAFCGFRDNYLHMQRPGVEMADAGHVA